jgi:hypothetical protein
MLKAYTSRDAYEEHSAVVFGETTGKARVAAASVHECEFMEVKDLKRAPQYDKYAPGPVPRSVLVADGWWFECCGCYATVDADTPAPVFDGDWTWCSAECRDKKRAI